MRHSRERVLDIDTIQDWDLAEALVSYYERLEGE